MGLLYAVTSALTCLYCLVHVGTAQTEIRDSDASSCSRLLDVAIIGAGPAGAYSAYKLRQANQTVELFEYSDRIGGRLYTLPMPNKTFSFVELGAINYKSKIHTRVDGLVDELKLTKYSMDFFAKPETIKYYVRGQILTLDEMLHGQVPFSLSFEEKENQCNLTKYYLTKLTGFDEPVLRKDQLMKLKVRDGRPLYKLTFNEALDIVATVEGKEYIKSFCGHDSYFAEETSATELFYAILGDNNIQGPATFLKDGMSKLPEAMVDAFLAASDRHKLNLNKKLEGLYKSDDGLYRLELSATTTKEGVTKKTNDLETLCAKKVILAIPQRALTELNWAPLWASKNLDALTAVNPVHAGKVLMSFPKAWWLSDGSNSTSFLKSDTPFMVMFDESPSNVTEEAVLVGSSVESFKSEFLENMNSQGRPIPGSAVGVNKVTYSLKEEILTHIAQALGKRRDEIPEPVSAASKFWSEYPYGGGWSVWKAGYHCDDVREKIQHPSLTDDVYVVGSDFAFSQSNIWIESALASVDEVFDKFSL